MIHCSRETAFLPIEFFFKAYPYNTTLRITYEPKLLSAPVFLLSVRTRDNRPRKRAYKNESLCITRATVLRVRGPRLGRVQQNTYTDPHRPTHVRARGKGEKSDPPRQVCVRVRVASRTRTVIIITRAHAADDGTVRSGEWEKKNVRHDSYDPVCVCALIVWTRLGDNRNSCGTKRYYIVIRACTVGYYTMCVYGNGFRENKPEPARPHTAVRYNVK